jgi:Sec-independent protein translocase protein TatA
LRSVRPATELQLDLFGLGPTEIVIVVGTGLVLFGPDTIKKRFAGNMGGDAKAARNSDWTTQGRAERIARMRAYADAARRERTAWRKDNEALRNDDDE